MIVYFLNKLFVLDVHESDKDSTKSSHMPHTQVPLLLTSYINTSVIVSEPNIDTCYQLQFIHYSDFVSISPVRMFCSRTTSRTPQDTWGSCVPRFPPECGSSQTFLTVDDLDVSEERWPGVF